MTYPKIHSLSTIGIIHHHNCDYLFHPLRTDFTGESGCGKSMISDMLQLILVGPGAYESSTHAYGDRKPQNMVIKRNGVGQGYIFINVALEDQQFVVIGSCIEGGTGTVSNFIIQQGYDWKDKLTPFQKPLYVNQLIHQNSILPFDKLQSHLESTGHYAKRFGIRQYLEILYKNEIVPVDLSQSDKTLKSYAQILRSFSRGKVFSKKSKDLKDFLFGDEKEKELRKEFDQDVKNVKEDLENHKSLKSEIDLITKKQTRLNELTSLYNEYKKDEKNYYKSKISYLTGLTGKLDKEVKSKQKEYEKIFVEYCHLQVNSWKALVRDIAGLNQKLIAATQGLTGQEGQKENLKRISNLADEDHFKRRQEKENIDKLQSLVKLFQTDIDGLGKAVELDQVRSNEKNILNNFLLGLQKENLVQIFEKENWPSGYINAREATNKKLKFLESKIAELKLMAVFTNMQDENSLARWGLEHFKRPLTLQEESILMYLQRFPYKISQNFSRYLNNPLELFSNLDIKDISENGFWLNLDGMYEFIPNAETPLLDSEQKQSNLKMLAGSLLSEIEKTESAKNELDRLMKYLDTVQNLERIVELYPQHNKVLNYNTILPVEFSVQMINNLIPLFPKRLNIEAELLKVQQEANQAANNLLNYERSIEEFTKDKQDVEEHFKKTGINDAYLYNQKLGIKISNLENEFSLFKKQYSISNDSIALIESSLKSIADPVEIAEKASLKVSLSEDIKKLNARLQEVSSTLNKTKIDFKALVQEDIEEKLNVVEDAIDPDTYLLEKYNKSKITYQTKYQISVEELEDKATLQDSYHLGKLASAMLPTIFKSSRVEEAVIDVKISEKLTELNRRASSISERKIEILSKVFSKVYDTYSDYLETINQIKNYLSGEKRRITGGNRVSLSHIKSKDFPDGWFAPFRKKLTAELMNTGLFATLAKEFDIYDMMIKAFRENGGSGNVTPDDLLNPKSYFDLEFDLKLDNNASNDGSTGQTYAATALLGIARLSHVEKNQQGKKSKGLRFMPVDEAEGLGSNYNLLYEISKDEDYQIISMSIEPVGDFREGEQYIYILNENPVAELDSFNPPFGIFSGGPITENIQEYISRNE